MSSQPGVPDISLDPQPQPPIASLGWALRRAALGLLILLVGVALGAWLLHASIEPDDASTGQPAEMQTAAPKG